MGEVLRIVRDDLHEMIDKWPDGIEVWTAVGTYIVSVGATAPPDLRKIAHEFGTRAKEAYMTTAEMLRAEGPRRGSDRPADPAVRRAPRFSPGPHRRCHTPDQLKIWTRRVLGASTLDEALG
ncbi:MAG: hypothetical protein ACT4RN_15250 [Pseudonocardia sp.]